MGLSLRGHRLGFSHPVAVHLLLTPSLHPQFSGLWIILASAISLGLVAACCGIVRHHILNVDWREPPAAAAAQQLGESYGTEASPSQVDDDELVPAYAPAKGQQTASRVCLTVSASHPSCGDPGQRLSFGGALRKLAGNVFVVRGADALRGEIERIECSEDSLAQPQLRQRALDNEFKGRKQN